MPGICRSRNTRSGEALADALDGFGAGRRRAGHLDAGLGGEQRHQPLARHRLIVGDEDANHHATATDAAFVGLGERGAEAECRCRRRRRRRDSRGWSAPPVRRTGDRAATAYSPARRLPALPVLRRTRRHRLGRAATACRRRPALRWSACRAATIGSRPWRIAFSTSGCRISVGTSDVHRGRIDPVLDPQRGCRSAPARCRDRRAGTPAPRRARLPARRPCAA